MNLLMKLDLFVFPSIVRSCLNLFLKRFEFSNIVKSCMSPLMELSLYIFQYCQFIFEPVNGTFWYPPTLSGHVCICYWNSLNIPNGQVMYEPIDLILWSFLVFSSHVWTCWLNFPWYSGCHQVNVWNCCSNILYMFPNVARSSLNLWIEHSLNSQVLSGHVWIFFWKFLEYFGIVRSCVNLLLNFLCMFLNSLSSNRIGTPN